MKNPFFFKAVFEKQQVRGNGVLTKKLIKRFLHFGYSFDFRSLGPGPLALGPGPLALSLGLGPQALGLGPQALGLGPQALGLGVPIQFFTQNSKFKPKQSQNHPKIGANPNIEEPIEKWKPSKWTKRLR